MTGKDMKKIIYAIVLISVSAGIIGVGGGSADAAITRKATLPWAPNSETVTGYEVYYGKTPDSSKMRQLPVPVNQTSLPLPHNSIS
jgi:hypothetical protein